jgi:tRNA (cmo5U34)-methyltransferase
MDADTSEWASTEHARGYLAKQDTIPRRTEGEATILEVLPARIDRFVDLGTGDGRLLALVLAARPDARATGLDMSPPMLAAARERFAGDARVEIIDHDLNDPLPELGPVDAIVSSFAIHHCPDPRKRSLYEEVFARLRPGGVFVNLEHVRSPTQSLHIQFLAAMDMTLADEDRSNILLDVGTQLRWLREIGFDDVDCLWKWRELALLAGVKPPVVTRA